MLIGLVRHFKVNCDTQIFMTSDEFEKWVLKYDSSNIIENEIDIDHIKWDKCFSSDLPRAIKTSEAIFRSGVTKTKLLREVPLSPTFKTNIKLPYIFWCLSGRLAWSFYHKSQKETKQDTQRRANKFLDQLNNESDSNILIVCHGFFMQELQKELKRRGFNGKYVRYPKNGTLYLYKK